MSLSRKWSRSSLDGSSHRLRLLKYLFFLLLVHIDSAGLAQPTSCATPALTQLTEHYARSFGIDADLLVALIWVESRFCQTAVSPKGAIGLGQLMPATAAELNADPNDVHQNLWGAAYYLRERYVDFDDWTLALAAYNAGPGAVRQYGGVPPYEETRLYVRRVLDVYRDLKRRRAAGK